MTLVGKLAPRFVTKAVINGKIQDRCSLEDFKDKYVLLFFYPLDFTFVCPTELHAFQEKLAEFEKHSVAVIGCSVDSAFAHLAWLQLPRHRGGIQGVTYPLLSDLTKSISQSYGVLKEDEGIAYRGLFLIDKKGYVRHELVNDLPLGRSIDEALRMVEALIFFEQNGEVCPANWKEGQPSMKANQEGVEAYFSNSAPAGTH